MKDICGRQPGQMIINVIRHASILAQIHNRQGGEIWQKNQITRLNINIHSTIHSTGNKNQELEAGLHNHNIH